MPTPSELPTTPLAIKDWVEVVTGIATCLAVVAGSYAAIRGISAWRREHVGRRRVDLAESTLAKIYEAKEIVEDIRNPSSGPEEGKSRPKSDFEPEESARLRDYAYVPFERFKSHEKFFSELRATKFRYMAAFGPETESAFKQIDSVVRKVLIAARMLGSHYWPRQGRVPMSAEQFQKHLDEMHANEARIWRGVDPEDELDAELAGATREFEYIAAKVTGARRKRPKS